MFKHKIDSAIRFFLYVLIFWLPYSPAVVEICVIVSLVFWIIKRGILASQRSTLAAAPGLLGYLKAFQPIPTILNAPTAFFLAACLFSVIGSAFFEQSLHNFLTKTLEWFIVYFLVLEVFHNKKHIYIFIFIFIFTSLATVFDSIIQFYFTHRDLFLGHTILPGDRPTAGFKTPNGLGGYLTLVMPVSFAVIFLEKKTYPYRLLGWVMFLLACWSLILTFSRGAWVGTLFGGLFMLLTFLFYRQKLKFYFSLGFLLTTVFLYVLFLFTLAGSSNSGLLARFDTLQWRSGIWYESIRMVKDNLLFGHGINTFMQLFEAYRTDMGNGPTYAHNCYIQLAVETGMVGLFGFLWIMVDLFRKSVTHLNLYGTTDSTLAILAVGLLSGIFAFLVHSLFDTNLYSLQLSVYLWIMIGIQVAILRELKWQSVNAH